MPDLDRQTQIKLRDMIRQKINVDRFKGRRTWDSLALDLDTTDITLRASLNRNNSKGKLTPDQLKYARLMRGEWEKHREEFARYTYKGIAESLGIGVNTVERWMLRILEERR